MLRDNPGILCIHVTLLELNVNREYLVSGEQQEQSRTHKKVDILVCIVVTNPSNEGAY